MNSCEADQCLLDGKDEEGGVLREVIRRQMGPAGSSDQPCIYINLVRTSLP
jgi:hypothetical protein